MDFIFTCQTNSSKIAIEELSLKDNSFVFEKWLADGVGLASTSYDLKTFAKVVFEKPIIFIRHIFRVDMILNYRSNWKYHLLKFAKGKMPKDAPFCVQLRHSSNNEIDFLSMIKGISAELVEAGFVLDMNNFEQVISIFVGGEDIYVGIDRPENNLSRYKGGMPGFPEDDTFVSRAEFKMLEALEVFKIDTAKLKNGADFGAAPGGWTKALAERGINMTAIDPADMDEKVTTLENVTHEQMTIQEYFFHHNDKQFDIIVNDMKMDARKSIQITSNFYDKLSADGVVIMTLKLPKNFNLKLITNHLNLLKQKFKVISARQLFHNRSEITVALRKKVD